MNADQSEISPFAPRVKAFVIEFTNTKNNNSSNNNLAPRSQNPNYTSQNSTFLSALGISAQPLVINTSITTTTQPLLTQLNEFSANYEAIIITHSTSKFYNSNACLRLLNNFFTYHADIGFADNYPKGMVFEIIRKEALPVLENIRQQNRTPEDENIVDALVAIDVNAFTLENLYAEKNLAALRINLIENTPQNKFTANRLAKGLQSKNSRPLSELNLIDIAQFIEENLDILKTLPSFYEWHIAPKPQEKIYSPLYKKLPPLKIANTSPMDLQNFNTMLTKAKNFCNTATMQLSAALGDPTDHPEWKKIVTTILDAGFSCFVETDATSLTREDVNSLIALPNGKNLTFVLLINAIDNECYQKLHGIPKPTNLIENVERLLLQHPENIYVEIVKTDDTIEHIEPFYNHFKRFSKKIIISKYNNFRNRLPERRERVMEPLEKMPCWHLRRDMVIDPTGDVWLCKQDIKKEHPLGNLLLHDFATIFAEGEKAYKKHLSGFEFCSGCDEYYTFNF